MSSWSFYLKSAVYVVMLLAFISAGAPVARSADLEECYDGYKELATKPKARAMVVSQSKELCFWGWSYSSQNEANRSVLNDCKKEANDCRLFDAERDIALLKKQQKEERQKEVQEIEQAQIKLKELGFYSGPIDGLRGPGTIAAIKSFQRRRQLAESGTLNSSTKYELSRPNPSSLNEITLCNAALGSDKRSWDARSSYVDYVAEANRRNLTVDSCRATIGLATTVDYDSRIIASLARLSTENICRGAYSANTSNWDQSPLFASHVEEARRRGLSIDDCRIALGHEREDSRTNSDAIRLRPNEAICTSALIPTRTRFSSLAAYIPEVNEAKRRGLSVDDCRTVIGLPVLVNAQTQTPKDDSGINASLARLSTENICRGAYSANTSNWDQSSLFARHVEEARRRGLSVNDCRIALGLNESSIVVRDDAIRLRPNEAICTSALIPTRTRFSSLESFRPEVEEANRRGLSVDDCRVAIGLASTNPQPAENVIVLSDSTTMQDRLSLTEICERSLNSDKTDWSSSASATEARKQADTLGVTVGICRVTLGIGTKQKIADTSSASDQTAENNIPVSPSTPLQKKVALVIGNSNYQHSPVLANPHNDAEAVASALSGLGFEVIKGLDLGNSETVAKVREFAKAAKTADLSLLYYAGHGLQIAGENYIVPVDAVVEDETAVSFELINVSTITNFMGGLDKIGVVLLDACRDNPFSRSLKRSLSASRAASVEQGLAPISAEGGGLFVAFATAPGDVAADGEGMNNSPFTTALLKHLPTKGLEINTVMTRVKAEVAKMTKNDQRPWTNSDLTTEVYLAPAQ